MTPTPAATGGTPRVRFDRNELAGAFGDIGTDLPLLIGMIAAAGLDAASVLVVFGALQVATGFAYGMPMPVQPLKAMAVLVISGAASAETLYGGGVAIGIAMLLLAATGLLGLVARAVPKSVVRGVQLGLGLQLGLLALGRYVPADGSAGWALAAAAFAATVALLGNRRIPAALVVIGLGAAYALAFRLDASAVAGGFGLDHPDLHLPSWEAIATGFVVLALPQLPLSLGNSILATRQVTQDLFPDRAPGVARIGLTYAAMNVLAPLAGGVPACHGSGGVAGHHAFGARTGGSVVLYGSIYLALGLFLSGAFTDVVAVFPLPVLGVILLFEGLALILLVRDLGQDRGALAIALLVGLSAAGLPYGYLIGMAAGIALHHLVKRDIVGLGRSAA